MRAKSIALWKDPWERDQDGIVGIVAGVAAQKPLANVLAGIQIALAQPVRVDDVVIVEGEWGRVEEITLTYVVVHVWDDRRLVLPLSYFIEKPFQNWTRTSSRLLGTVFIWVDYSFPVEEGRAALQEIIEASPRWDKRFWNLQVTDADFEKAAHFQAQTGAEREGKERNRGTITSEDSEENPTKDRIIPLSSSRVHTCTSDDLAAAGLEPARPLRSSGF